MKKAFSLAGLLAAVAIGASGFAGGYVSANGPALDPNRPLLHYGAGSRWGGEPTWYVYCKPGKFLSATYRAGEEYGDSDWIRMSCETKE